jgi:hypothetical protein
MQKKNAWICFRADFEPKYLISRWSWRKLQGPLIYISLHPALMVSCCLLDNWTRAMNLWQHTLTRLWGLANLASLRADEIWVRKSHFCSGRSVPAGSLFSDKKLQLSQFISLRNFSHTLFAHIPGLYLVIWAANKKERTVLIVNRSHYWEKVL